MYHFVHFSNTNYLAKWLCCMYIKWYTKLLPPVFKKLETAINLNLISMFSTIEWLHLCGILNPFLKNSVFMCKKKNNNTDLLAFSYISRIIVIRMLFIVLCLIPSIKHCPSLPTGDRIVNKLWNLSSGGCNIN